MTKAIFFDVDGTLLSFQTHAMAPSTLEALHTLRKKGIKLFLSTGRHQSMIDNVRKLIPFDGFITLNGQYCFCGDVVLRSVPMDRYDMELLVELACANRFPCMFLEEKDSYMNQVGPHTNIFPDQLDIPLPRLDDPRRALGGQLFQAVVFLPVEQQHLLTDRAHNLNPMRWHPDFIDVIAKGGGKDRGMDAILAHFGISTEDTMAFGDGENDLAMLRHAAIGVAMGNAGDAVKAGADYVTSSVDEDGVARALAHFGLI